MARRPVPPLQELPLGAVPSFISPVMPIGLASANARLRRYARTEVFENRAHVTRGRVDMAALQDLEPGWDESHIAVGKGVDGQATLYAGIYEGHQGSATSVVLRQKLIPIISQHLAELSMLNTEEIVEGRLKHAMRSMQNKIERTAGKRFREDGEPLSEGPFCAENISALAPMNSLSSATVCMYDLLTGILRTAHLGASRAIRGDLNDRIGEYFLRVLTQEHNELNAEEVADVNARHPGEEATIWSPQMSGERGGASLLGSPVTRAFGGLRWRWPQDKIELLHSYGLCRPPIPEYLSPPYLQITPDVTNSQPASWDFVILASSGF
ncbi:Fc.00g072030.m01.CDS01 [Cosmosporella sp. VM-42]